MAPSRLVTWLVGALLAWLVLHELHVVVPGLDGLVLIAGGHPRADEIGEDWGAAC